MSQAKPPFKASPPPPRKLRPVDFPRGEGKCASCRCRGNSPGLLVGWRGEGGVICGSMPFNNGSSDWTQIQHEDGQWFSAPLLFRQDLPNSYWWLTASFGEFILWSEAIKGSQNSDWPSVNYTTFYRQHLCVNEGSRPQQHKWNSKVVIS